MHKPIITVSPSSNCRGKDANPAPYMGINNCNIVELLKPGTADIPISAQEMFTSKVALQESTRWRRIRKLDSF